MPQFTYVALDSRGQESTGLVEAVSSSDAIGQLRLAGYFPTDVYEEGHDVAPEKKARRSAKTITPGGAGAKRKRLVLFQKKTVKAKTLMVFTRSSRP